MTTTIGYQIMLQLDAAALLTKERRRLVVARIINGMSDRERQTLQAATTVETLTTAQLAVLKQLKRACDVYVAHPVEARKVG